jgi:hypothetical protein
LRCRVLEACLVLLRDEAVDSLPARQRGCAISAVRNGNVVADALDREGIERAACASIAASRVPHG